MHLSLVSADYRLSHILALIDRHWTMDMYLFYSLAETFTFEFLTVPVPEIGDTWEATYTKCLWVGANDKHVAVWVESNGPMAWMFSNDVTAMNLGFPRESRP